MAVRNLFLIWRWNDLSAEGKTYETLPVADGAGSRLLRINENIRAAELKNIVLDICRASPSESLILMHRSGYSLEEKKQLADLQTELPDPVRYYEFGGGDDYIYYKMQTDSGLITQSYDLAHGRKFSDAQGNYKRPEMLNEKGLLETYYFDKVWRFYFYQLKRRLYEFRVRVLRYLSQRSNEENSKLLIRSILESERPELLKEYEMLSAALSAAYGSDEKNLKAWATLDELVRQNPLKLSEELHILQERFDNLLDSIQEPIYA